MIKLRIAALIVLSFLVTAQINGGILKWLGAEMLVNGIKDTFKEMERDLRENGPHNPDNGNQGNNRDHVEDGKVVEDHDGDKSNNSDDGNSANND